MTTVWSAGGPDPRNRMKRWWGTWELRVKVNKHWWTSLMDVCLNVNSESSQHLEGSKASRMPFAFLCYWTVWYAEDQEVASINGRLNSEPVSGLWGRVVQLLHLDKLPYNRCCSGYCWSLIDHRTPCRRLLEWTCRLHRISKGKQNISHATYK